MAAIVFWGPAKPAQLGRITLDLDDPDVANEASYLGSRAEASITPPKRPIRASIRREVQPFQHFSFADPGLEA